MPDSQTELEAPSSGVKGQADVKPATESSTAEPSTEAKGVDQNKPTMLDAVKKALADGSEKSPDSELTPDTKTGTEVKAAGDKAELADGEEVPADEMKQYSRGAQYRIRQLSAQRKAETERVKELQPKAENFDRITNMMQKNQLSQKEVDDGFEIMGLMKLAPQKALEKLAPMVKKLLAATGHNLPDDLKAEVEAGAITEARARELSVARSTATHLSTRVEQDAETQAKETENRRVTAVIETATKTADAWHSEKAKSDPDWYLKQKPVSEKIKLSILESKKFPQTDKEMRTLLDGVLKEVEADLKHFIPKKTTIKSNTGSASPDAKPEPKTMLDAMKQAVAR